MLYMYFWVATQIIIEMLPISSSGHLTLLELFLQKFAGFDLEKVFLNQETIQLVYYFLHGPTVFIVCGYFFSRWMFLIKSSQKIAWHLFLCLLIADGITYALYLLFKYYQPRIPLGIGFIITALALFCTHYCLGNKAIELLSFSDAFIFGITQGFALLPGISRLAFTSCIGCFLGFSLFDAFFLSWTMQVPLMAAAFKKSVNKLNKTEALAQILNPTMGLVILISGGISTLIMTLVLCMIKHNIYYFFGWYMIVPLFIWLWITQKYRGSNNVRDIQKSSN